MPDTIRLQVTGMDKLERNIAAFGDEISKGLKPAGEEMAREILDTEGLRKYPGVTAANAPGRTREVMFRGAKGLATFRQGYYVRTDGAYVPVRGGGYKALHNSENYGKRFTTKTEAGYGFRTTIGNSAKYAGYLAGDDQAGAMAKIGWRKLYDVAESKMGKLTDILQAYINRIIRKLGLD